MEKRKIKKSNFFYEKNDINFSYTSYNQIDSKGIKIKIVSAPKSQTYESLLRDCKIGTSTVIIKKNS